MPKSATTSTPRIPTQEEYKSLCRLINTLNTLKYCDIKASDKQAYFDALWKSKDELEHVLHDLLLAHDISAPSIARMLQHEIAYISEQANPLYQENLWVDDALAQLRRVQSLADRQPWPLRGLSINTTEAREADDSALPAEQTPAAEPAGHQAKAIPKKWLPEALLLVRDNPEWSDNKIAGKVDVWASTLSRSPEYQRGATLARGKKEDLPKGHRTTDGAIEAYGPD